MRRAAAVAFWVVAVLPFAIHAAPPAANPAGALAPSVRVAAAVSADRRDVFLAVARTGEHLVAVGRRGVVLESTNSAVDWERDQISDGPPLIDVAVCPDGAFFLLDFRRGLWSRSGDSWKRREIRPGPSTAEALSEPARSLAITCDAAGRLWAVGEGSSILRSDDRGARWLHTSPSQRDRLLTAVGFLDAKHGRVLGEFGTYFETADGGETWRRGPDLPDDLYPHSAYFDSDGRIWAVGNYGRVLRLSPGSDTWVAEATGTRAALYGIARAGSRLVAVGAQGIGLVRDAAPGAGPWRELRLSAETTGGFVGYLRGVAGLGGAAFVAVGQGAALRVELAAEGARAVEGGR